MTLFTGSKTMQGWFVIHWCHCHRRKLAATRFDTKYAHTTVSHIQLQCRFSYIMPTTSAEILFTPLIITHTPNNNSYPYILCSWQSRETGGENSKCTSKITQQIIVNFYNCHHQYFLCYYWFSLQKNLVNPNVFEFMFRVVCERGVFACVCLKNVLTGIFI